MQSIRRIVALAPTVALLTVLAASSALGNDNDAKSLHLVKTCPTFDTDHSCLVTTSTLKLLRGATFHYLDAANLGLEAGSPMLITTASATKDHGTANGVCHFNDATGVGHCEFTSGTESLSGFHANLAVLYIGGADFSLTGTYWFTEENEDDD
jgi:hypothetical protein